MTPASASGADGEQTMDFGDAAELDVWLSAHPGRQAGVWLRIAKKGSGATSVTAAEVNDVALCHGWITGHRKGLDETYFLQRITPRRPGSDWSMVNVRRVEELTAAGRMRPGGVAEVAAARADGRWDRAYESQRNAAVPDDLAAALERSPKAAEAFARLNRTERYTAMLGLLKARDPALRAARLDAVVAGLEESEAPGGEDRT